MAREVTGVLDVFSVPTIDTASGLYQGQRKNQQDAVVSLKDVETGVSLMALSDGMGGAGYGNIASRVILRSAFETIRDRFDKIAGEPGQVPELLREAAYKANRKLADIIKRNPEMSGMGGTLMLTVLVNKTLYWLSIGDSLMYRMSKGSLERLNADHSLASGLDNLASLGQIDPRIAKTMAARSTLTSALQGEELGQIDCPKTGMPISKGDTILIASDGIQSVSEKTISALLMGSKTSSAAELAAQTIRTVEDAQVSGQDNLAVCITRL